MFCVTLPATAVPDGTIVEHGGKKYGLYKRLGAQTAAALSLVFDHFVFLVADLKDAIPGPDNQLNLAKFKLIDAHTDVTINFGTDTELGAFLAVFAPYVEKVAAPPAAVEKDGHRWVYGTVTPLGDGWTCEYCKKYVRKDPASVVIASGPCTENPAKPVGKAATPTDDKAVIMYYGHCWRKQADGLTWVCDNCHDSTFSHPPGVVQEECRGSGYARRGPYRIVHAPVNGLEDRRWGDVLGAFGTLDMAKQKVKSEVLPTLLGLKAVANRGYAIKRLDDRVAIVNVDTGVWTPVNLEEL